MALPLDSFIGFGQLGFVSEEKNWVALTLNKSGRNEGKYDFTGSEFTLSTSAMAGIVQGDDHWLIAVIGSGSCNKGGVFEFKVWKQGIDGAKGAFDKVEGEKQAVAWQKDGCLAAIYVNDIPVLKTFVKVLSELSIIVTNESKEILVKVNPEAGEAAVLVELEASLSKYWSFCIGNENADPEEGTPEYDAALFVQQSGLMSQPCLTKEMLPSVALKGVTGKITGHKIECFPFVGEPCPYDSITVTLPKKEEKKASKGNWSGGGSVDPKAVLDARKAFFLAEMAAFNPDIKTIKDVYEFATPPKNTLTPYMELVLQIMGQ